MDHQLYPNRSWNFFFYLINWLRTVVFTWVKWQYNSWNLHFLLLSIVLDGTTSTSNSSSSSSSSVFSKIRFNLFDFNGVNAALPNAVEVFDDALFASSYTSVLSN